MERISLESARYDLALRALDPIHLPRFAGATIRGGFGIALRGAVCATGFPNCHGCYMAQQCFYLRLFDDPSRVHALSVPGIGNRFSTAPKPLVIGIGLGPTTVAPGEILSIGLTLVGSAIELLPFVVAAFSRLGNLGLTNRRSRFEVLSVDSLGLDGERCRVYVKGAHSIGPPVHRLSWSHFEQRAAKLLDSAPSDGHLTMDIEFRTPLRIKTAGELQSSPDFGAIGRAVLRRTAVLSEVYCGGTWRPTRQQLEELHAARTMCDNTRWVDLERYSARQHDWMSLGGFVGRVSFSDVPRWVVPFMLCAEVIHVGKGTMFGLGRLDVSAVGGGAFDSGKSAYHAPRAEPPLVPALQDAWTRVHANGGGPGADGVCLEDYGSRLGPEIAALARDLESGDYWPYALRQVEVTKPTGGLRALAYPTVRDRVAQTALMQRLQPRFELEFESSSFAYRKGRSVRDVIFRVRELRESGYRWVVDADVDDFFDSVPHDQLLGRVARVVPSHHDRLLLALWVTAPRWDGKGLFVPERGIPQGAVVSPTLANLFLDELDEALQARGHKLVRYADDFLILCRTESEAKGALDLTDDVLQRLGLRLDEEKTSITDFERGFRFLGALFVRSLIAVPFSRAKEARRPRVTDDVPALPAHLWRDWLETNHVSWRRYVHAALHGSG